METVQNHPFRALFLTTLFTGLRRGEVCGLRWDCVDLEHGTITISKQLQNIPGQPGAYRLVSTKNGKSRTLKASRFVVDLRHSYAVASLQAGDDIKTIQANLGHHTASFPLDIYGQAFFIRFRSAPLHL